MHLDVFSPLDTFVGNMSKAHQYDKRQCSRSLSALRGPSAEQLRYLRPRDLFLLPTLLRPEDISVKCCGLVLIVLKGR